MSPNNNKKMPSKSHVRRERRRAANTCRLLLQALPEHFLSDLLCEWLSVRDVRVLVEAGMIGRNMLTRMAAQPHFVLRAAGVLAEPSLRWLAQHGVRVVLRSSYNEDRRGNRTWRLNGEKHRDGDLPAFIDENGDQFWYQHRRLHRGAEGTKGDCVPDGDLPAVVWHYGKKSWFQHGELHRAGGRPAIVNWCGAESFFERGRPVFGSK